MRWHIVRTLLHKEVLRHAANRGGIVLAVLLVVMAMLLSFFGRHDPRTAALGGEITHCYVDYWEAGPWIEHLRRTVPDELRASITFRPLEQVPTWNGRITYPINAGAIQVRSEAGARGERPQYLVWFWYPGADRAGITPYEAWFWRETFNYYFDAAAESLGRVSPQARAALREPDIKVAWSSLHGGLDARAALAAALVLFALFFVCVYLLPSLTCEEHERGVLLAQALSPASAQEILAAKFLFYPLVAMVLAAILAGTYRPAVLLQGYFWLVLAVAAIGSLGIGLTIASLARTQRAASMGALCYMLVVALFLFICQQNNVPVLPWLALEYHCPRMLHAALSGLVAPYHWYNLLGAAFLAGLWSIAAVELFRRRGWQ